MIGAYPQWDMEPMERDYDVHKLWLAADKEAFLDMTAPHARAIATRGELGASAALIDKCPKLELIACYGVGVDAIDLAKARARSVRVTNTPDLAHLRKVIDGDAHVRSGAWSAAALPLGTILRGKTLGILGFGRIGRATARRAEGFGVSIAYCDVAPAAGSASVYYDSPIALARASDILVAAVAGGEATRKMVDADVFEALGPSGLFVNVSGGSVVDEPALIQALAQRRIGGACLD